MHILVIEDNKDIAANLGDYLEDCGHAVEFAADGVTGLHLAVVNDFDAIVLDLNLPGMDGLDVCRRLREDARKQTPVLMLTARDSLDNKLEGFESGADDYLIKPFALQEVEVRLNALVRRGKAPPSRVLRVADLEYDLDTLEVRRAGKLYNAASVLRDGQILASHAPPGCGGRYFADGRDHAVLQLPGLRLGLCIGTGARTDCASELAASGAHALALLDATPFYQGAPAAREADWAQLARQSRLPLLCARAAGSADALVFDGHSLALQANGTPAARAPGFVAAHTFVEIDAQDTQNSPVTLAAGHITPLADNEHQLWAALVRALRDYVKNNGFGDVVLGLSGGIDSALVLALAVDALGAARVRTLMLPSPYTSDISVQDAREMAQRMGVRHDTIAIAPLFDAFRTALAPLFAACPQDSTEENLQARIRATLLMGLANKFDSLLLSTGNKSEAAVGYSTLYGDMAGGFAPLQDVFKTEVFALARWRNAHDPFGGGGNPIPERIITRPPSAELRPQQTDQDSLPPYDVLDAIVRQHMAAALGDNAPPDIPLAASPETVRRVLHLVRASEHKRQQAAPGVRVSRHSFAADWHAPLTSRFARA